MAQYRQSGADRFALRNHDFNPIATAADQISIRIPHKQARIRRPTRPDKNHRRISVSAVAVILSLGLLVTLFAFHYLSRDKELRRMTERSETGFRNQSSSFKVLKFGQGSVTVGRDSRYWDRDDRRRDSDYEEDDVLEHVDVGNDRIPENERSRNKQASVEGSQGKKDEKGGVKTGSGGLYNEGGRAELESYKKEYEASLKKNGGQSRQENVVEETNLGDEYDDGIDLQDARDDGDHIVDGGIDKSDAAGDDGTEASSVFSGESGGISKADHGNAGGVSVSLSTSEKKPGSKRKPKHHKLSSPSCEMKFMNSTAELIEPFDNKKFSRFSLQYTEVEERPSGSEKWEPRFAGHQSPQEREDSYYARDQKINCGFIKGPKGSPSTGFDLAEDDVRFMSSCHIAVSSCIFGNSDNLRIPYSKTITRVSRKNVCFIMFVDEDTLQTLLSEGQTMDSMGFIGLWKIVVVKNLPFTDMRRVGKIPKFLTHRLFPSARYSIWLDSKLRLQKDPLLILEYFLWRRGYEYAISNHYDRHCVWEEVMQNKKLNKFNHTIIDQQFEFYQADGLERFDPSDPNRLLPSYVPEGSFIVRAHTPMSNLFSCLWFNEVDHFTPRDQLSFAYTNLKLRRMNPGKPFHLNMFKDCERRSVAKLFHHRAEDKRNPLTEAIR